MFISGLFVLFYVQFLDPFGKLNKRISKFKYTAELIIQPSASLTFATTVHSLQFQLMSS